MKNWLLKKIHSVLDNTNIEFRRFGFIIWIMIELGTFTFMMPYSKTRKGAFFRIKLYTPPSPFSIKPLSTYNKQITFKTKYELDPWYSSSVRERAINAFT